MTYPGPTTFPGIATYPGAIAPPRSPGNFATETFKVFAYDQNTNSLLNELPVNNLSYDSRLGDAGSISFDLNLQSPAVQKLVTPILDYDGVQFAVYVERNGQINWGGSCLTGAYNRATGMLSCGGKEFLAYFDQRKTAAPYTATEYPTGIDPAALIAKAINDAQSSALCGPGASIGISVLGGTSTLPKMIPGYPLTQYTMVSRLIADMLAISVPGFGGLDLTQVTQWVGGFPQTNFVISSPRAGRVAGSTGLIFDLDSCVDYDWPTNAADSGNTIIATGSGTGAAMPTAIVNAPGIPVGGLGQAPRLDKVMSFQSAQSQQQISAAATGAAQTFGKPVATPKITVLTDGNLGTWALGDDARLYTPGNERFPNGKDQYWRIVQQTVTVPDAGVATVALTFNLPPNY